jgi:hypothetical protein
MTLSEGLQLLNLLVLPGVYYIIRLEKRIFELELRLKVYFEINEGKNHGN